MDEKISIYEKDTNEYNNIIIESQSIYKEAFNIFYKSGDKPFKYIISLRQNNELIGVCGLDDFEHSNILYSLAIKNEYRNKGNGTRILKYCESQCKTNLFLYPDDNVVNFYIKNGYEYNDKYDKTVCYKYF